MSLKAVETLTKLCPDGGWILRGINYEDIEWIDNQPLCSKAQYEAGFAQYDALKAEEEAEQAAAKAAAEAKLRALGLTADDLKALGL